jgi:hypothetical protein
VAEGDHEGADAQVFGSPVHIGDRTRAAKKAVKEAVEFGKDIAAGLKG